MSATLSLSRASGSLNTRPSSSRSKCLAPTKNSSSSRTRCVLARADGTDMSPLKPPAGVTMPPKQPSVPAAMFGFVDWAEKLNSRAAMIGFFALLALEGATNKPFLELIGWTIGNGLNVGL